MAVEPVMWLDGHFVSAGSHDLIRAQSYGAYTSFRVEEGAVRGLDLHLSRLSAWAVALFGEDIDRAAVLQGVVCALSGQDEAWVKLSLFSDQITPRTPEAVVRPRVLISVAPAPAPLASGQRCLGIVHERYRPEIKHVATFDLIHARREARLQGYDDVVLINRQGQITEGGTWNIGFVEAGAIVWPQGPMLDGVAQILIKRALAELGIEQRHEVIDHRGLRAMEAAFLCNSATPCAAIASINEIQFSDSPKLITKLAEAWHLHRPQRLRA